MRLKLVTTVVTQAGTQQQDEETVASQDGLLEMQNSFAQPALHHRDHNNVPWVWSCPGCEDAIGVPLQRDAPASVSECFTKCPCPWPVVHAQGQPGVIHGIGM